MGGVPVRGRKSVRTLRLASATALACVALAVSLPGLSFAQDISSAAASLSPDAEMLLEADTIIYDNDRNTVTAVGGVQIDYDGNRLVAQRVTYDRATMRLVASGNVELVGPDGTKIYSDEIDITDDFRDGFVRAMRVETADKTYFAAESADRRDGALTTFNYGVYTACEPCEEKPDKAPVWRIKAQKIIWNGQTKTVRFERARLEMFGMPLAFLPAFEIADPTVKQKSGFLTPTYTSTSELGYGVRVPYYWALSPSYDVTFTPAWYSKQGFLGQAEWRQRLNNGEYSITVAGIRQRSPEEFYSSVLSNSWINDDRDFRGMIGSRGAFQINPRWSFGWDVMAQTDKNFSYTYSVSGYNQYSRVNQVYLTGLNDRNYFDLRAYRFNVQEAIRDYDSQTGQPTGVRNAKQPWVLPSLDYSYTPDATIAGGELTLDVNVQGVKRDLLDQVDYAGTHGPQSAVRGIEGTSGRVTAEAEWKRSFVTDGGLMLTPLLHGRSDAIGADYSGESRNEIAALAADNAQQADIRSSYYRAMATAGFEARWPVLMSAPGSSHVIEPMAQLFVRPDEPYGSSVGIPNEDAQSLVFDASNLFERDKFSGYDRIEGGVRANLGFRYSGSFENGWSTSGVFGQSIHLAGENPFASPDLVHVGAYSGLETNRSDYVAALGVGSPTGFSLNAGVRLDETTFDLRRTDLTSAYTSPTLSVSGTYSFIEAQPDYGFTEDRQELRGRASVKLFENWGVFGGGTYDMTRNVFVEKSIGFAYDDECFSFTLSATEYVDRIDSSQKTQSFGFRISLRTLGDFGSSGNEANPF